MFTTIDDPQRQVRNIQYTRDLANRQNYYEDFEDNDIIEGWEDNEFIGEVSRKNKIARQLKSQFYLSAKEILQLEKTTEKDQDKINNSVGSDQREYEKKELEMVYEIGWKEHQEYYKPQDMFKVELKDQFELLEMYTDTYPLLNQRKIILYVLDYISFVCFKIVKNKVFDQMILFIILFNTLIMIMRDPRATPTPIQNAIDTFFLWAYTAEMSLKISALGFILNKGSYLRDGWNVLDFTIVISSLLPLILGGDKSVNFKGLRSLRILRPLRTISSIHALKLILLTLFSAVPFLIDTFIVLFFYLLVFAIAGLQLFKGAFKQRCIDPSNGINYFSHDDAEYFCGGYQDCMPNPTPGIYGQGTFICAKMIKNPLHSQNYDTIFYSLLYMFQSCTLEGWTNNMYWTAYTISVYTLPFHMILVFIGANILINLTLAVIKAKFSDTEQQLEAKKRLEQNMDDMDEDDIEHKRIQDEEEAKKNEEASSESEEEVIPTVEVMKKYSGEIRLKTRQLLKVSQEEKNLNAGQNKEINFIDFGQLMALKEQIKEEDHVEAERIKQQQLLDFYKEAQKKAMRKLIKKDARKKTYNQKINIQIRQSTKNLTIKPNSSVSSPMNPNNNSPQKSPIGLVSSKLNFCEDQEPPKHKRNFSAADPKKEMHVAWDLNSQVESKLTPRSNRSQITLHLNEKKIVTIKESPNDNLILQKGFDTILQNLDDIQPLEDILTKFQASKNEPIQRRKMLRSPRKKQLLEIVPNAAILKTYAIAVAAEERSDVMSNFNDEDLPTVSFKKILHSNDDSDSDSDDQLNRFDQIEKDKIKQGGNSLAQAISQRSLNSRPANVRKKTLMDAKLRKNHDPNARGSIIQGLQEHLRQLALKQQVVQEAQEQVQPEKTQNLAFHTYDDNGNGDYNKLEEEVVILNTITEKESKVGLLRRYKLVPSLNHEYHSSSRIDIMNVKLQLRELRRTNLLEKQIRQKHYTYFYLTYNELLLPKKMKDKTKKYPKTQTFSFTMQNVAVQNVRIPITKAGIERKNTYFIKMQQKVTIDISSNLASKILEKNLDRSTQYDKSIVRAQSKEIKSVRVFRPREQINKQNFIIIEKAINEDLEDNIVQFELPVEKLYLQIQGQDFATGIKSALHWSGDEVFNFPIQRKRANKIRLMLNSANQNKMMFLAGLEGYLIVKRSMLRNFVEGKIVSNFVTLVVIANTVILSLNGLVLGENETAVIEVCNTVFTWIFIVEMSLKIISFGPLGYLRDTMNIFDGFIVTLSVLEMTMLSGSGGKAVSAFRVIRVFRVLRITRLLRSMQFMGVIIKVVSTTLENFIYICGLMFLFIIIYALLGMQIFGGKLNYRLNNERAGFDTFLYAFLAMFQLLTIENWDDLIQLTIQSHVNKYLSMIYLISFVFIGNYVFLNLFLAILMDGFSNALDDAVVDDGEQRHEDDQFMQTIRDAVLGSHPDLDIEMKQYEYQMECEKRKGTMAFYPEDQNVSMKSSTQDAELEIDIVNNTAKIHTTLFEGIACEDSIFIFNKLNFFRILCYKIITHSNFESIIQVFIITSSLKLAVDTYIDPHSQTGYVSQKIDIVINLAFTCECITKIIAFGFSLDKNSYLSESWSKLDFFIVCVSLIDMSFSGVNIHAIKILRLLRVLRPLRFISHNVNLKTIVTALFESLSGIVNVLVVVLLIWLMFAILGISLLGGRFGRCIVNGNIANSYYGINQHDCIGQSDQTEYGNVWFNMVPNMDNIYNAMIMVFCLTTLEGWPNILYPAMDSDSANVGPSRDNYKMVCFYFIAFIMVSSFMLINLFTGVICYYFQSASKNERKKGNIFLTQEQENWIEIQTMTIGVSVGDIVKKRPKNILRGLFFDLVEFKKFDTFIMVCIVFNIIVMAMNYEGQYVRYNNTLENINMVFTIVFMCECISKITAYGITDYLQSGWNRFDLFVVTSSTLDILLSLFASSQISFLKVGPQLIRIIRVLRVTRLLKLIKSMRSLQKLLQTLLYSLPALINIGALTLLVFYIFAILAVFLFKEAPLTDYLNDLNNFKNFGLSIITLYRCSTGENWEWVMYDVTAVSAFAPLFFMVFLMVSTWIMLNLFTLIIIQYFENYNIKEDNPLGVFQENLEIFRQTWLLFTVHTNGEKLHQRHIIEFFQAMPHPLGFGKTVRRSFKKASLAKEIMSMHLVGNRDGLGNVYFNEVLYAAIKRAAGKKIFGKAQKDFDMELLIYLNKAETDTRDIIEYNKNQDLKLKKFTYLTSRKNLINPLVTFLFNRMVFSAWKNYAILKTRNEETPKIQSQIDCLDDQEYDEYVESKGLELNLRGVEHFKEDQINKQLEILYSPAIKTLDQNLTQEDFYSNRLKFLSQPHSEGFAQAYN